MSLLLYTNTVLMGSIQDTNTVLHSITVRYTQQSRNVRSAALDDSNRLYWNTEIRSKYSRHQTHAICNNDISIRFSALLWQTLKPWQLSQQAITANALQRSYEILLNN